MKCHPLRWAWGLIPLAVLSLLAALSIKDNVERDLTGRVSEVLGNAGLPWAKIKFDGRDGTLSGRANDESEPGKAIQLGNAISGVRIFDGQADLLPKVDPYTWAAETVGSKLVLTGFVPNETTRKAVVAAAKAQFPKLELADKLDFARGNPPVADFVEGVRFGLRQLAALKAGKVELVGTALSLQGEAPTSAVYKDVRAALTTGLPKAVKLGSDKVTAPRVDPYTWAAKLAGNQLVLSGYVPGEKQREQMVAAAKAAFGKTPVFDRMDVGDGAPEGWDRAAKATLDQLATLQEGAAELKGTQLILSGSAVDEATADATRKAFKAQVGAPYKTTEAIKGLKAQVSPYPTRVSATASTVELTGYVPSETARASLVSAVKARFAGRAVSDSLQIAAGEPVGHETCLMAAVGGLARLGGGQADMVDRAMDLTGKTEDEAVALALAGDVRSAAKGACETKVNVVYDDSRKRKATEDADARARAEAQAAEKAKRDAELAAQAKIEAKRDVEAERKIAAASACETKLRSTAQSGTVQFERASDVLLRPSLPTVRRLAEVAMSCDNALIEIEGHTDSEGTPERNQALSERRAQAVADFLAEAGVPSDRIKAIGYGQTRPVAGNDTAENRAKNRRIEFTVKSK
jgi:outer membrane protein OmpA-like peptidoglycan-associated protein/osmotically-inducible protein OsmY